MFLLFIGCDVVIFAPSKEDRQERKEKQVSTPNCPTRGVRA